MRRRPNNYKDRIYKRLSETDSMGRYKLKSDERTKIVLQSIENHPYGMLEFPPHRGLPALLMNINLSPEYLKRYLKQHRTTKIPKWWSKERHRAELADANLTDAWLGSANFQEAILIAASFDRAQLSRANFHRAGLPLAQFSETNAWEVIFTEANLPQANFYNANLNQANFQGALLAGADFRKADLTGADFRNAKPNEGFGAPSVGADFREANLQGSNLARVDFTDCKLTGIYISRARLEKTVLTREQIGEQIGEEIDKDYSNAANGYFILRKNFEDLGDHRAAQWAYLKERRMIKNWHRFQASRNLKQKHFLASFREFIFWAGDWSVEVVCDYGESVWRVTRAILLLIFLIGPLLILLTGRLIWTETNISIYQAFTTSWEKFHYSYFQTLLFVLDTVTTANLSNLRPANDLVTLAANFISLAGIFLVGLLGFVAGNRIRHK